MTKPRIRFCRKPVFGTHFHHTFTIFEYSDGSKFGARGGPSFGDLKGEYGKYARDSEQPGIGKDYSEEPQCEHNVEFDSDEEVRGKQFLFEIFVRSMNGGRFDYDFAFFYMNAKTCNTLTAHGWIAMGMKLPDFIGKDTMRYPGIDSTFTHSQLEIFLRFLTEKLADLSPTGDPAQTMAAIMLANAINKMFGHAVRIGVNAGRAYREYQDRKQGTEPSGHGTPGGGSGPSGHGNPGSGSSSRSGAGFGGRSSAGSSSGWWGSSSGSRFESGPRFESRSGPRFESGPRFSQSSWRSSFRTNFGFGSGSGGSSYRTNFGSGFGGSSAGPNFGSSFRPGSSYSGSSYYGGDWSRRRRSSNSNWQPGGGSSSNTGGRSWGYGTSWHQSYSGYDYHRAGGRTYTGGWSRTFRSNVRYSASNVSPLVLDLGCDGVSITPIETGVYFDIQNNGFVHKVGWIDVNEGLLALDANHNGVIDDVSELFGDMKCNRCNAQCAVDRTRRDSVKVVAFRGVA